jgi:hypothetical protein
MPDKPVVDQHHRVRVVEVVGQRRAFDERRHHEQAIDAAAHRAQCHALLFRMAVVTGDEEIQIVLARHLVDAAHQLGKEFAVQVGQDDADRAGAPAAEAARRVVRDVAQLLRGIDHPAARRRGATFCWPLRARETVATDTWASLPRPGSLQRLPSPAPIAVASECKRFHNGCKRL